VSRRVDVRYYVLDEEVITLDDLPEGTVFFVGDVGAVKSEYKYGNEPDSQWQCVLLASGEYAHFSEKNKTIITGFLRVQFLSE
jgi:hypothetical protein